MANSILPEDVEGKVSELVGLTINAMEFEVYTPDGQDEMDAYQHVVRGRCMTCGGELKKHSVIVVAPPGILGIWCDGECMSAMQGISFMREIEDRTVAYLDEKGKSDE